MDSTGQNNLKRNKSEKKLLRKQIKARNTLMRHEGIECVSHTTKSLVVANGGLGNGVNRHQLLRIVEECGLVEALLMPPNKPYSFMKYGSTEEAKKAYDTLNGKEITLEDSGQNVTLYVNFVEKAQKSLKHRRVKHFGYEFRYDNNNVDKDKPLPGGLPGICRMLLEKCLKQGYIKHKPDQLTINQYEPGQGIPPHIDTHSAFEDEITSLSLGAELVLSAPLCSASESSLNTPCVYFMPPFIPGITSPYKANGLFLRTTHFSHDAYRKLPIDKCEGGGRITPRKFDIVHASERQKVGSVTPDVGDLTLNRRGTRTSFTFRKVRRSPCNCIYPSVCDSQQGHQREEAPSFHDSETEAPKLEQEYVHKVYEEIATHFSSTRHSPWPQIVAFLRTLPKGSIVADVGCGNGKYLGINKDLYMIGCDRSQNLVDICGEKKFQAFVCDALSVPVRNSSCDACISIAVIHHFSTAERRLAAVCELARLLRPGGKALIYVWAMEQEYNKQKSKYLKEKRDSKGKEEEINRDAAWGLFCDQTHDNGSQDSACSDQILNDSKDKGGNAKQVINSKLPVHTNRTSFHSQDVLVPWHLKGGTNKKGECSKVLQLPAGSKELQEFSPVFHRYYHVFCEGELEAACKTLDCIRIQKSYYDQGNWCVVLEKQ
ncbi:Alkylated DNA repair protein alkB like protein 8 [Chelonia mydas]|uniref:tRNA (carboxymethyluridine(34)-5-O)-methyltransferase ALKBH8 n=1 Tax=Chelonia mydas TaxID=8469 RepID=M7C5V5_CHEMY|nr:Alkylated DNA repair protein alkB like protein 8 [Chelonia mydas]